MRESDVTSFHAHEATAHRSPPPAPHPTRSTRHRKRSPSKTPTRYALAPRHALTHAPSSLMSALVDRLQALPPEQLSRRAPVTPEVVARVEQTFDLRFPSDFLDVLAWSNGFGMSYHKTNFSVRRLETLESDNLDDQYEENIPGMFVLGTDGGGAIYFFDPRGALGHGEFAVFLVPQSELGFKDAMLVGSTFTEALHAALDGEDFFRRPRLKELSPSPNV